MRSIRTTIVTTLFALAPAITPALADVIIIRATGPSAARYVAGRTLPDAARVVLLRGDQLVLLDSHGTRTVAGPGNFPAADKATASSSSLLALASNTADRRNRVGAVRNLPTNAATLRPNIFMVDVAAPGNVCVVNPASATLWRAMADNSATSTISGATGAPATLSWIKGQSTQPWPAALPITPGSSYRLVQSGGATPAAPVTIAFQLLAAPPADLPQLAQDLIAHQCTAQIDVVVATASPAAR